MKAISIRQPYADAILFLGKTVENRSWRTDFRGPIAIHASSKWDGSGAAWMKWKLRPLNPDVDRVIDEARNRRGGLVGIANVVDVMRIEEYLKHTSDRWATGPYCFILNRVQVSPFIPFEGRLSLFELGGVLTKTGFRPGNDR